MSNKKVDYPKDKRIEKFHKVKSEFPIHIDLDNFYSIISKVSFKIKETKLLIPNNKHTEFENTVAFTEAEIIEAYEVFVKKYLTNSDFADTEFFDLEIEMEKE